MTAHRPRRTEFGDEVGLVDVLLFGTTWPRSLRRAVIWVPPTDVFETAVAVGAGLVTLDGQPGGHPRRVAAREILDLIESIRA